ncbi:MAG: ATP-dependent helicase HrpB [Planctomycetota bacterium]|jgi:ATP-dependent helicase HrpB|nr:ATP-dependent helicase HrpB [Planctomycetota bacterium]
MQALPIDADVPGIVAAVAAHGSCVLTAPPGAGKSTRVPPALLAQCSGSAILLQPRRVAAVTLARRIADEQGWELGREVGYRIRFERQGGADTRLWVQTEGTLTRQMQHDPYLEGVGLVILDEFHERSVHADLALAWLRELRRTVRPDLQLVVMSATMVAEPVASFLGDAPIVAVSGAPYPVTTGFRAGKGRERIAEHCARVIDEALGSGDGDILAFLPGKGEIQACAGVLAGHAGVTVLPLHGALPPAEQERALGPCEGRKVVLATNVAETSLTVPGVHTVVDSGWARISRMNPDTGFDELHLERISRFSAEQRAGRAGRTGPGRCFRLWSKLEDIRLTTATVPELRRCDLAPVTLVLKELHGADVAGFPWFEAPEPERLAAADDLLGLLGLVGPGGLSGAGRLVARMPVHPRLGRLLLEAASCQAMELGAEVAALVSERDLRLRDAGPAEQASADVHDRRERLDDARHGGFRPGLRGRGIDPGAAREVDRAIAQLRRAIADIAEGDGRDRAEELVPRLLLAGFPDRIARRSAPDANTARLVGGRGVMIEASSALYARKGQPRAQLLVATAVQGLRRSGASLLLLQQGAEITEELLDAVVPGGIETCEQLSYHPQRDRVVATVVRRYRDLDLFFAESQPADMAAANACLLEALAPTAEALVLADARCGPWLCRYRFVQTALPELGLPAVDPTQVLADAGQACVTKAALLKADLLGLLQGRLSHQQIQAVAEHAPEAIVLPSGRRARIDYAADRPTLASRIQDFFGLGATPRLADGQVAVLIHLLAPNGRPAQITDDLASFWANTYPQVRKDLRGRYPKHAWPERPDAGA